jgi:ribosomal protein S18 acetylase RimI-like enzyme
MPDDLTIRAFRIEDYDAAVHLWSRVEGVEIAEGDSREEITAYLSRNPDLSRAAEADGQLIGVALCGHDGRRGLIYHVAVDAAFQQRGVARQLVNECVAGLRRVGLKRALILVARDNTAGETFWRRCGWEQVPNVKVFGIDL